MKVNKHTRMQHRIGKKGAFVVGLLDGFTPVDCGTVNIEALMNFTPEQHKWLESMFYITMGYLNKNIKVELGKFGTLETAFEYDKDAIREGEDLTADCIKKIRLKLKESKDAKGLLEMMRDEIEIM